MHSVQNQIEILRCNQSKKLAEQLPVRGYQTYLHTDQGWQYRHRTCRQLLLKSGLKPSMSRKATALDNAAMESFFNKLKTEIGELSQFHSVAELKTAIQEWIHYYKTECIQIKLKGQSLIEYRQLAS
ncbi:integrase core domain-containing protein [Leuconostocaceae bacterium ESL0958]|nr:integrase core domain-containing protein [Leuconostocaceae bacterium ESL0958]